MKILLILFSLCFPLICSATPTGGTPSEHISYKEKRIARQEESIKENLYKKYKKADLEDLLKHEKRVKKALDASRKVKNDGRSRRLELEQAVLSDLIEKHLNH